jgi:hypothetical protein
MPRKPRQTVKEGVTFSEGDFTAIHLYVRKDIVAGIQACADRDSRPLDHMFNVALESYVAGRKLGRVGAPV